MVLSSLLGPAIGLSLVAALAHGQGGPPLETDDPGTPGNRHWEVNAAVTLEHTSEGTRYEAPLGDGNYGVGGRIQLKVEIPLLLESGPGARAGLGNPILGMKWRFLQNSRSRLALSTYPQLKLRSPIGPLRDAEDESSLLLPVEVAMAWDLLGINAEAGYRMVQDGADQVVYGLALGYQPTRKLELLSECNGSSDQSGASSEVVCQVGARQELAEHFSLLGALGTAVAGNVAERARMRMYLGLQSRW